MGLDRELYRQEDVLHVLSISEGTFRKHIEKGFLPEGKKVPGVRSVRWMRQDLEDYITRIRLGLFADDDSPADDDEHDESPKRKKS